MGAGPIMNVTLGKRRIHMNNILTALMTLLVKHWRPGFILLMGLVVVVGILNLKRFSASSSRLGDDEIDSASLVIEGGSKVERRLRFPLHCL